MKNDLSKILIDSENLQNKIREIGEQISIDYEDKNLVLICILRGAVMFLSDLLKNISIPVTIDFLSVSSYGQSTESSGVVKIRKDIDTDISNCHVIVVEDIVDSGLTLKYIHDYLKQHQPASVKTCALLDKSEAHQISLNIDYSGFQIGNDFVVGFGLDYAEKYRNLPYIGVLKKEIYT